MKSQLIILMAHGHGIDKIFKKMVNFVKTTCHLQKRTLLVAASKISTKTKLERHKAIPQPFGTVGSNLEPTETFTP